MGTVTALQDMLMHSRRGVVYIFPALLQHWENVRFKDMPCEGGFLISAEIRQRILQPVTIRSQFGGRLTLGNPWGNRTVKAVTGGNIIEISGEILELDIPAGKTCSLSI